MDLEFMKRLSRQETIAEEILTDQQLIVDSDRRRNGNREALGKLRRGDAYKRENKAWVNFGDMFIRLPKDRTVCLIEKDQDTLTREIDSLRNSLKKKVQEVDRLEGKQSMASHFELKGVGKEEFLRITDT